MSRPRLLDLFCGAGGASAGYERAGFEVTGIDHRFQKNYPFDFVQADALEYVADHGHEFDVIHSSPPCQHYASVTKWRGVPGNHPDLLGPSRKALEAIGKPWIIENVERAPMRPDYILCGSHFELKVRRHRWFETSWHGFAFSPICRHVGLLSFEHKQERVYADAMGCQWMTNREAREAIPPAYTQYIGEQLLLHISEEELSTTTAITRR